MLNEEVLIAWKSNWVVLSVEAVSSDNIVLYNYAEIELTQFFAKLLVESWCVLLCQRKSEKNMLVIPNT